MVNINRETRKTMSTNDDRWSHALSLELIKERTEKRAELEFMKELFDKHLPVGENREDIDAVFSRLEKAMFTKDEILNDEFDDGPALDAGLQPDYRYYTSSLFKQHASSDRNIRIPQIMGDHTNPRQPDKAVSGSSKKPEPVSYVSEHSEGSDSDIQDRIFGGEDSGDT